jgi:hypothetical protein
MDAFSLFQSETSLFNDEQTSFMSFLGADKARTMWQSSPKSTILPSKQKSDATKTHTDSQNKERPTHSNFKFQIQIARKRTRGSERCEKDRTAKNIKEKMQHVN